MTIRFVLAALAALSLTAASAEAKGRSAAGAACHPITRAGVAALFDRWNASLKTLDPHKVVANYAADSILLPTVSNTPRITEAQKLDYFEHFLLKKPQGEIGDVRMIQIGCDTAFDAGLYAFTFGDGSVVKARYTYTYGYRGGRWLITSHHSSVLPEK